MNYHESAITGDPALECALKSKEGSDSGHAAILEVEVNRGGNPIAGTTGFLLRRDVREVPVFDQVETLRGGHSGAKV